MISGIYNCSLLSWFFKKNDQESQLAQLAKQVLKTEDSSVRQKYETMRAEMIDAAFKRKKSDSSYKLSALAQKVYDTALKITDARDAGKILDHGQEYAFLTSEPHFLHKHIETLELWNPGTAKVQIRENELELRTYQNRCIRHKVTNLMQHVKENPAVVLDYNYFAIDERTDCNSELKPSFKEKGDGRYHVSVVVDCPLKRMQLEGSHAWLRLIDPQGVVYSVGKFPKKLRVPYVYRKEEVMYSNSDAHEWLCRKGAIEETRFTIKEEDYNRLKADIVHDMNNRERRDFNSFHRNCSDWAIEKLAKIGLSIDKKIIEVDQFEVLVSPLSDIYEDRMPRAVKKVFDPVLSALSYLGLQAVRIAMIVSFGGFTKNPVNNHSRCFLHSPKKLYDPELTKVTHPWRLNRFVAQNREKIQGVYDKATITIPVGA